MEGELGVGREHLYVWRFLSSCSRNKNHPHPPPMANPEPCLESLLHLKSILLSVTALKVPSPSSGSWHLGGPLKLGQVRKRICLISLYSSPNTDPKLTLIFIGISC